jgi:hypothetical protein
VQVQDVCADSVQELAGMADQQQRLGPPGDQKEKIDGVRVTVRGKREKEQKEQKCVMLQ